MASSPGRSIIRRMSSLASQEHCVGLPILVTQTGEDPSLHCLTWSWVNCPDGSRPTVEVLAHPLSATRMMKANNRKRLVSDFEIVI